MHSYIMQEQMAFIEAQGSLALRARAHLLHADSHLRATPPEHLPEVMPTVETHLTAAIAHCDSADWWTIGAHAAALLALARKAAGDDAGCEVASQKALAFEDASAAADSDIVV